jgi:hypothetical protein
MAPRRIVIDKSVIDEINFGNVDFARVVRRLMEAKTEIWMTAGDRARLFRDAEQRLIAEIGVKSPIQDTNPARYENQLNPGRATEAVPHEFVPTAVLALEMDAPVLSADRRAVANFARVNGSRGGAPERASVTYVIGKAPANTIDYNVGRRLLQLSPLRFGANGRIPPPPPNPVVSLEYKTQGMRIGRGARIGTEGTRIGAEDMRVGTDGMRIGTGGRIGTEGMTVNKRIGTIDPTANAPKMIPDPSGPRDGSGARTTKNTYVTQVDVHDAVTPEYGLSAAGDAKFQGGVIVLKGMNFGIQAINDAIQKQRLARRWAEKLPDVIKNLDANPEFGALILIYYSRAQGGGEIEGVTIFRDIHVAYGWNEADALRRRGVHAQLGAAAPGDTVPAKFWYPPKHEVDVMKLPTPWPVAGLATFVPGKEKLTKVKFSFAAGFDEKMFSRDSLDVPDGAPLRFVYLWPPHDIQWLDWDKRVKRKHVEWVLSREADVTNAAIGPLFQGVPVVTLDSSINPYDTTAAMVWPADSYTKAVFEAARPTDDGGILTPIYDISLLRWIKPEFIRLIRDSSAK